MSDEIIRIREELVGLSSDPIKTRELLDKLTEEEILQHDIESPYHVSKNDIEEEKDFDFYKVCKTSNGYLIHYKGGYTVYVDEKNHSACGALQMLMDDTSTMDGEDKEGYENAQSAVELIFRLPMFIFSHAPTTFNIATLATKYLIYLQEKGEVLTEETENPEYDKFLLQMNELLDNFAAGLEKEGLEYEKRNGIDNGEKEREIESEGESEGSDKQAEQKGA